MNNNMITLTGTIATPFVFDHTEERISYYRCFMEVGRFSDTKDVLPLLVSDCEVDVTKDYTGAEIEVTGEIRSSRSEDKNGSHLVLNVNADHITFTQEPTDCHTNNHVILSGYLIKPPVYRKTPFGRQIADILLVSRRENGFCDFVPVIVWGQNARYASELRAGDTITIVGRFQSREYTKCLSETESEVRVAYEVSVKQLVGPKKS